MKIRHLSPSRLILSRLSIETSPSRQGVMHFRVFGKGDKTRLVPVHRRRDNTAFRSS
jgi:hypothetical protein